MKIVNFIVLMLLVVAGFNWFIIGAFDINVIGLYLGNKSMATRVLYILFGLSAFHVLVNIKHYG